MMDDRFKILSLDGGGVRGYLTILMLVKLEKYLQEKNNDALTIGERFDLIAGTSTGAIIAALLALGNSAEEILELYEKDIPYIFSWKRRFLISWIYSKYNNKRLKEKAIEYFSTDTFKDVKIDLLIPAVNLINAEHKIFRSDFLDKNDLSRLISDAVIASSSAPTYFSAHKSNDGSFYSDGGIVANNPSLLAILDALDFKRESKNTRYNRKIKKASPSSLDDIILISIGTGKVGSLPYSIKNSFSLFKFLRLNLFHGGKLFWAKPIVDLLMENQSNLVDDQVSKIMGTQGVYIRINPTIKEKIDLDDADSIKNLTAYADEVENYYTDISKVFVKLNNQIITH